MHHTERDELKKAITVLLGFIDDGEKVGARSNGRGSNWTDQEVQTLTVLFSLGKPDTEIDDELYKLTGYRRGPGAVADRRAKLGLYKNGQ